MEFRAPLRRHRWQQRCLPFFFLSPISTSFFVIFVSCVFARDNKWSNDQIKSYSFYHTQTHTSRFGVWSALCTFSNCANATHKCNLFGWCVDVCDAEKFNCAWNWPCFSPFSGEWQRERPSSGRSWQTRFIWDGEMGAERNWNSAPTGPNEQQWKPK